MSPKNLFLLFYVVLFFGCTKQTNWNQYLGPNRNNIISDVKILKEWPDEGPSKLWEVELGPGFGGASIFENEVFILDRAQGESDVLRCLDIETGTEKWNFEYEAKGELPYPGSRAVPSVDENYIWSVGPHGHFYCINKKSHKAIWSHNLLQDFGGDLPNWGFSQSPIITKELAIVAAQGETAGFVAYNKLSGELAWKSRRFTGYRFHVSPTLGHYGGIEQVIMISSCVKGDGFTTDEVVAFNANTGEELWSYKGLDSFASIAPAVVVDENRLFLTACAYKDNYDPISIMLEISVENNVFKLKELFRNEEAGCKMHPGVIAENHIYVNNNGNPNELVCLNMNGERVWKEKSAPSFELGSIIKVGDLLIAQNGKNGDIHLIEPSQEVYKELGKASFFNSDKSQAWAPMAFSQGKLFARDMEKMVCIDLQN